MADVALRGTARRADWYAYALLAPGALTVVLLAIVPILFVFRNSFAFSDPYGAVIGGFTLDNYQSLLNPQYAKTIVQSLQLASVTTAICLALGYIISNYIVSKSASRQSILLLLLIIPFWTDFLVRMYAIMALLGNGGPIRSSLSLIGIETGTLLPSHAAVMFGLVYAFLPTAVFPIYAAMRSIDQSVREAASDLGCGWWRTHLRIIGPLSMPGIASSFMLTFIPSLGVFVIPVLLGGGKDLLVGNLIVTLYTEFRNQPVGAALSMLVMFLMLFFGAIGLIGLRLRNRRP
jgi:spermidine/putrescine transport system permease protein